MAPVALLFLLFSSSQNASNGIEMALDSLTLFLLIGAGAVTAIPLLLFATGAKRISLSLIGFLQYIGPTIMLFLGVFLYHEPFSLVQLIAFLFIWAGLFIFTFSRLSRFRKIFERLTTFYKPKEKSL
nr:EamA family transporter [Halalkalibacter nanhaiisediminis]